MSPPGAPLPPTRQRILTGDARSLGAIATGSIELVVTSPPYPMIGMWDETFRRANPAIRRALVEADGDLAYRLMHEELDRAWDELCRVLVPGGIACVNVGDATRTIEGAFRLYANHSRILEALEHRGLRSLPHILWRKQTNAPTKFMGSGMLPPGAYVTLEHEHILVLRKGGARALPSPTDKARRRRSAYFWEERNIWFSDLWDLKGARQSLDSDASRERSGAFPFELAYRLVAMFSLQLDTVLDPFLGTGTTSLACAALGRHSVGIEMDDALARSAALSLATSAGPLNQWTQDRLGRHLRFIRDRAAAAGPLAHVNAPNGFAVVTGQERELRLDFIRRIRTVAPGEIEVEYMTTAGSQMALGLGSEGD